MNQKSSVAQTLKFVRWALTSDILRFRSQFDPFGFWLLAPGTILLTIYFLSYFIYKFQDRSVAFFWAMFALAVYSLAFLSRELIWSMDSPTYQETEAKLLQRYSKVPTGSIVVLAHDNLRFLRNDLFFAEPKFKPYWSENEEWEKFLGRLRPGLPIYIDSGSNAWQMAKYHDSVQAVVGNRNDVWKFVQEGSD